MNQSESFVDFFRPWYDCQSSIDIKFLNYSGNVYYGHIEIVQPNPIRNSQALL